MRPVAYGKTKPKFETENSNGPSIHAVFYRLSGLSGRGLFLTPDLTIKIILYNSETMTINRLAENRN